MKVKSLDKYRIKAMVYNDGRIEYVAQEAIKILFFTYWKPFICETVDYGYAKIRIWCSASSYEECRKRLLDCLNERKKLYDKKKVVSSAIYSI